MCVFISELGSGQFPCSCRLTSGVSWGEVREAHGVTSQPKGEVNHASHEQCVYLTALHNLPKKWGV